MPKYTNTQQFIYRQWVSHHGRSTVSRMWTGFQVEFIERIHFSWRPQRPLCALAHYKLHGFLVGGIDNQCAARHYLNDR